MDVPSHLNVRHRAYPPYLAVKVVDLVAILAKPEVLEPAECVARRYAEL